MIHVSEQRPVDIGDEKGHTISPLERDRVLLSSRWPLGATKELPRASRWLEQDGIPIRRVRIHNESRTQAGDKHKRPSIARTPTSDQLEATPTHWEALLRFPNAPVYGTHRSRPFSYTFSKAWPNFHTMRVLGAGDKPEEKIKHVYLLHNGLNETLDLLFHYRLAAWILNGRHDAICIIRPLPGHLTRYPFHGSFCETPLDSYLRDPMELFRQFIRHMLETQWLLSTILPRSRYAIAAGGRLLPGARNDPPHEPTRENGLAKEIRDEWVAAFEDSSNKADDSGRSQYSRLPVTIDDMEQIVDDIRNLLDWDAAPPDKPPQRIEDTERQTELAEYPYVHVVGYSMGGFMAQAGFFGWPQAVSSCTNLFAGGALRDLAPTAFAHPEEWQAVLHALRYELDGALAKGLLTPSRSLTSGRIAGVDANDFGYLKRIFYEVFLQYYKGGYSSRVAEFSRRLLFVVGGDDPIVRTENVLDASPPEGITLLQLADVSHFPTGAAWKEDAQQQVERDQRTFWLPEIGRVIDRFSVRAESTLQNSLAECWNDGDAPPPADGAPGGGDRRKGGNLGRGRNAQGSQEGLENRVFERELDLLLNVVDFDSPGWLLISRNEIPPVFLGQKGFRFHARALHHSEELITKYRQSLVAREKQLKKLADRMTLLVPEESADWFLDKDLREKLFARSETPGAAQIPTPHELKEMLDYFTGTWVSAGATRGVTTAEYRFDKLGELGTAEERRLEKADRLSLTILPDIWIGLTHDLCTELRNGGRDDREENESAIVEWITQLALEKKGAEEQLASALADGQLIALKVSAAELNPRYRGHRLREDRVVSRALRHWALSYTASSPSLKPRTSQPGEIRRRRRWRWPLLRPSR
jgi:pimeloyl-ACP methyl ester carboxylesterase